MSVPDTEPLHRQLVVLATDRYDDPGCPDLPGLAGEVDALTGWLCSPALGDRRFERRLPELADSPTRAQVVAALCDPGQEWTDTYAVFLFVTGHGAVDPPTHYLVLRQTESGRLRRTAVRTADLVGWLADTGLDHLLLVLDACHAGQVAEDVLRTVPDLPRTWAVLHSAKADEQADTGALTTAISEFLTDLAADSGVKFGFPGRYLTVHEFVANVQERLANGQTVLPLYGSWLGAHPCLPNPHVRDRTTVPTESIRRDLALPKAEVETHWSPRSRGLRQHREPGWLFTGRASLMRQLIAVATGAPGLTVVRGGAGTGKSAVLARLVTLSDPEFRQEYADAVARVPLDLLPPVRAVDIAVLAAGKLHTEVLSRIVEATGTSGRGDLQELLDRWHAWVSTRDEPVTLVVDALDEAANPDALAREVLVRLAPPGHEVRILVGVRTTHGTDAQGQGASTRILEAAAKTIVSVDEEPWWEPGDLRDYARSVLVNSEGSPYRGLDPRYLDEVAAVIATKAGRSFLVAGIHAGSLAARREVVRVGDPEWQRTLDAGVSGVLRDDLFATLPDAGDRERAVSLLRALAFSCGRGLPWRHVWPAVTTAIDAERSFGDSDIMWLLGSRLNGYLVTDEEDGVLVYRLFHDQLRGILLTDWRAVLA